MSTIINYFCGIWTHTFHISSLRMWESLSPLSYCWRWEQYAKFISYTSQGLCVWGHWSLGPVSYNYTPQGPSHDSRVHLPFGPCTVCVTHSCFLSLCPRGLPLCQEPFYWHFSLPFLYGSFRLQPGIIHLGAFNCIPVPETLSYLFYIYIFQTLHWPCIVLLVHYYLASELHLAH